MPVRGPSDTPTKSIWQKLTSERIRLAEAARAVGVHRATLGRYAQGERPVPMDVLRQLENLVQDRKLFRDGVRRKVVGHERRTLTQWATILSPEETRALEFLLADGLLVREEGFSTDAIGRRRPQQIIGPSQAPGRRGTARSLPSDVSGAELRDARRFVGRSVGELADTVGLAASTIRDMEASPTLPRGRIEELSTALHLRTKHGEIRRLRDDAGWSLEDVAGRLGVSRSTLDDWEKGRKPVPAGRQISLAALLYHAAGAAPAALESRREELLEEMVGDVATNGWVSQQALLSRHQATVGRMGAQIDKAAILEDAKARGLLVEVTKTMTGSRGGRRTVRGLVIPSGRSSGRRARLSGDGLAERREKHLGLTRRQLATLLGTTPGAVQQWEKRGQQPVPLHWEAALREILTAPRQRTPDQRAERAILEQLDASPEGMPEWRLRGAVAGELAGLHGRSKAYVRALKALEAAETVVRAGALDSQGRRYEGLYRAGQVPPVTDAPGRGLREARERAGWTVQAVAEAIGVRPNRLSRWELGHRRCPREIAGQIGELLASRAPPPTARTQRAISLLIDLAKLPGGIAPSSLPAKFRGPEGKAGIDRAIDRGLVHLEERLMPTQDGRTYVRPFIVAGPGEAARGRVDRLEGPALKQLRLASDLTQTALARRLGIGNVTVSSWESGRIPVPPGKVPEIRRICDQAALG